MNLKRFIIAFIAIFVGIEILGYVIHSVILMSTYESLKNVWRADMMQKMWIMHVVNVFMSILFVYIFTKGYENKGLVEGVRYGLIVGLFMSMPAAFSSYALYPIPYTLALKWFVFGMIEFIIYGLLVAVIYKPKRDTTA